MCGAWDMKNKAATINRMGIGLGLSLSLPIIVLISILICISLFPNLDNDYIIMGATSISICVFFVIFKIIIFFNDFFTSRLTKLNKEGE